MPLKTNKQEALKQKIKKLYVQHLRDNKLTKIE